MDAYLTTPLSPVANISFTKNRKPITTVCAFYSEFISLWQISVLQRTKANHNYLVLGYILSVPVANISFTKNESQSQLTATKHLYKATCGKYQFYKERKPITTKDPNNIKIMALWQISVLQRTKANHNKTSTIEIQPVPVANISFTKNESQSQHSRPRVSHSYTCGKYQFYKERKPITTSSRQVSECYNLWQISVLQRTNFHPYNLKKTPTS